MREDFKIKMNIST